MNSMLLVSENDQSLVNLLLSVLASADRQDSLRELLSPFCHECRNHLNSLKLGLYLAKQTPLTSETALWDEIDARYERIERFYERLQLIYRPLSLSLVRLPLALLFQDARDGWAERISRRGRQLIFDPPSESVDGDFDPCQLRQGFDAWISWRAEFGAAGQDVSLRWRTEGEHHVVEWSEPAVGDLAHQPGIENYPECLALPVLARILAAHGGSWSISAREGLRLTLRWPLVIRTS